jgi:hypothetical protein
MPYAPKWEQTGNNNNNNNNETKYSKNKEIFSEGMSSGLRAHTRPKCDGQTLTRFKHFPLLFNKGVAIKTLSKLYMIFSRQ